MKDFFNLRKSKLLLMTLLALLLGGVNSAWADQRTESFNGDLPEGWSLVGSVTHDDSRNRSGKGLWTSSKSSTQELIISLMQVLLMFMSILVLD